MTKEALAAAAGVSPNTVYRILRGEGEPDEATLGKLAGALGVPAPRVERVLAAGVVGEPQTPIGLVRAARAALERVERLLATSADADAAAGENQIGVGCGGRACAHRAHGALTVRSPRSRPCRSASRAAQGP